MSAIAYHKVTIVDENGESGIGAPPSQTATLEGCAVATSSGSLAAGALFATFVFSSDFEGTLNGQTWPGGASQTFPSIGKKYPEITYTITAGSITIFTAA